eukprot:s5097_g3.t1
MLQAITPESKRSQAKALKEEGNDLAKQGEKAEALKKYEKGIRLLGLLNYELDDEGLKAFEAQTEDGRELLSILAANAAQMYMDPANRQLSKAIQRCSLAIDANPNNAKALFRRASAAYDYADNVAKGADAILAQAQRDIRKFLQMDQENAAGKALQERLGRKRQALLGPIMRESAKPEPEVEPEWFQQVSQRAIFVCMCGSSAVGRDQIELPETLLSMASQAKDKKAISVGVAYVGYKSPDELEMFTEEWQKKYYRMLRLGERATRIPKPRQVVVHGEVYNVWSLLEGRLRVMRVGETRRNGEKVGVGWMRYCAQLLWHGEPYVYQSCRPYLRFAPMWDEWLRNDLAVALRRSQLKPVISWMSRTHEDERWQWISELVDVEGNCNVPPGALAAAAFDKNFGWIRWRRRFFNHSFGIPAPVAYFTPHNSFSTCDILTEVPADPCMNSLHFHGQLTCENVRLHSHGWDVFTPCANLTWETTHDSRQAARGFFRTSAEQIVPGRLLRSWKESCTWPSSSAATSDMRGVLSLVLVLAAAAVPVTRRVATEDPLRPSCVTVEDPFEDLRDVKIYALVYYGRRTYVDILNAYLERNLRENGGVLDGVIFAMVKYTMEDMNYLVMLHRRNPKSYIIPWHMQGGAWDVIWRLADQPGAYYIKIDDDVVYIADGAIAEMIREKRRGRFLFVSANVVNHGILSAVHQETSAIPHLVKPPIPEGQTPQEQKLGPWIFKSDLMTDPKYRIEHTFYSDCVWRLRMHTFLGRMDICANGG